MRFISWRWYIFQIGHIWSHTRFMFLDIHSSSISLFWLYIYTFQLQCMCSIEYSLVRIWMGYDWSIIKRISPINQHVSYDTNLSISLLENSALNYHNPKHRDIYIYIYIYIVYCMVGYTKQVLVHEIKIRYIFIAYFILLYCVHFNAEK